MVVLSFRRVLARSNVACQLLTSTTQFELEQISVYTDLCNMLVLVLQTSQVPSPVVPDDHSPTVPRAHRVLRPKRPRASGSDGQVSCHVGLRSQPCDSGNFDCNALYYCTTCSHLLSVVTIQADGLERPPKKLRVENINELRERITRFESLLDALEKKSLCKLQVKDWR